MGDIVRPDFRKKKPSGTQAGIPNDGRPLRFYGYVGPYSVALCREALSPTCAVFRVVVMRCDSSTLYSVATLPATEEGRRKAREIADTVLRTLWLTSLFCDHPGA